MMEPAIQHAAKRSTLTGINPQKSAFFLTLISVRLASATGMARIIAIFRYWAEADLQLSGHKDPEAVTQPALPAPRHQTFIHHGLHEAASAS
ncbi:hypothetical protein [Sphingomonas sp. S2-65]|uniref:hypothetical protein n=1 Tax=Sphingomonas sp. S2-65 TaxID=2903960 RepID=UPI001F393C78|nr:hypothetical protein [Sphingomonas sp. S2-65]UYY57093.1 hypothetical protein LZ586_10375 [Sphingomonas sp. S2-65]